MKNIVNIAISGILALTLLIGGSAAGYAKDDKDNLLKSTGGGEVNLPVSWLDDEDNWQEGENRVSFGFNAIPFGDKTEILNNPLGNYSQEVKGQFHLVDHDLKWNIKGEFASMLGWYPPVQEWNTGPIFGTCTINGEGPYEFTLNLNDWGEAGPIAQDWISLWINGKYIAVGWVAHGNIQIHTK